MANYSIRYDGEGDKAASIDGDKTLVAECMNITTYNAASFSPGDNIYVWSNGGVYWSSSLRPPSPGSSGSLINHHFDASVEMTGTNLHDSGWSESVVNTLVAEATGVTNSYNIHGNTTTGYEIANIWVATSDMDITQIIFSVYRYATPTAGDVWIQIWDESGGQPNAKVTDGKSSLIDVTTLSSSSNNWETVTFANPPSLTNGETYYFLVESDMTVDGVNCCRGRSDASVDFDYKSKYQSGWQAGTGTSGLAMKIYKEDSGPADVWNVAELSTVSDLHYDSTQGTKKASAVLCTSEGDWFWENATLYLYSTSDPATAYTDPGVEGSVSSRCIYSQQSYNGFYGSNAEIRYTTYYAIELKHDTKNIGSVVDSFVVHDIMVGFGGAIQGVAFINCQDLTASRIESYKAQWNAIQLTVWAIGQTAYTGNVIEECYAHDSDHGAFDIHNIFGRSPMEDVTIRHCLAHDSGNGILILNENSTGGDISEVYCYYNVCYSNTQNGISAIQTDSGGYIADSVFYGNTCWDNGVGQEGGGLVIYATNTKIKNNISFENQSGSYNTYEMAVADGGGTANEMDYNCVHHTSNTNIYRWDGTNYTAANIYSSTNQQEHPVHADPKFTNAAGGDFTLASDSPCLAPAGADLGDDYKLALNPGSSWPSNILTIDMDDHGWVIGAFAELGLIIGDLDHVVTMDAAPVSKISLLVTADMDHVVSMEPCDVTLIPLWNISIADIDHVISLESCNVQVTGDVEEEDIFSAVGYIIFKRIRQPWKRR